MFYNLLFSPSFNKDFSHLQGPPPDAKWETFKKGAYGYIIQHHNTGSGNKNFYFVSNTQDFLAFGIYASIFDFAKSDRVDKKYAMRRRGGDHSTLAEGVGDYPTEAAIGYFWDKSQDDEITEDTYLGVSTDNLLRMFETEIVPYWDRPRSAISAREHIVQPASIESDTKPYVDINCVSKIVSSFIGGKKDLLKAEKNCEENIFYALIHAVLHGKITRDFNFCTDFNSKSLFKGQKSMSLGTLHKKGFLKFKQSKADSVPANRF
jgi:hypothetical protein